MILTNEFTVEAGIDDVWKHLLDMEGVASCLPGATIEATDEEGVYKGSMRVRIGPMTVDYRGTARLTEVDEKNRIAKMSLSANTKKGQGTAMATVTNRLEPGDGGTRVLAETDLQITGPQAQFGRGVMEDVGSRVLAEFARRLEQQIAGNGDTVDGADDQAKSSTSPAAGADSADSDDDVLDLGSILSDSMVGRYSRIAAVGVAVVVSMLLLGVLFRSQRR